MIGELLAYFAGREAGRSRSRRRRPRKLTPHDIRQRRIVAIVIIVCLVVVLLFA